ncbi:DUF305 domain-containing protein [Streptomyces sp. V4-01]|uniref:DUF305 domain-containing protein n=1 Tax=Actinacidiphila polyblastidii TaxID=3110430 RepID=A0ABU7PH25_9ACTN|nr:DUF305 domain-containing protein [Streptomyces sp. V4-01]
MSVPPTERTAQAGRSAADAPAAAGRRPSGLHRGVQVLVVAVAAVVVLVTAGIVGRAAGGPEAPSGSSVSAGFARDMIDHHAQAVEMATIVHDRTRSSDVRYLATDIALTQTSQMGEMQGWLDAWRLPLGRTGQPMAWMRAGGDGMSMGAGGGGSVPAGMDPAMMRLGPDGLMPGMATTAQVNRLRTLAPAKADVLFLQLMVRHHRAGVAMAQMALDLTDNAQVDRLAQTMVTSQQAEIAQMTQMLHQRGATP